MNCSVTSERVSIVFGSISRCYCSVVVNQSDSVPLNSSEEKILLTTRFGHTMSECAFCKSLFYLKNIHKIC